MKKPVEYRENRTSFLGREIYIDSGAHIPRPSTEFIAQHYVDYLNQFTSPITVADIGTGTGVLALTFISDCKEVEKVYATEFYDDALSVAKKNIDKYEVADKVLLFKGNLFEPIKTKKVNVIFANLPFASEEKMKNLRPSVKNYEPLTGISGGQTGFELYESLFAQLKSYEYMETLDGIWIFCSKDHIPKVKKYHKSQFPNFNLQIFGDKFKEYYAHCLLSREIFSPVRYIEKVLTR